MLRKYVGVFLFCLASVNSARSQSIHFMERNKNEWKQEEHSLKASWKLRTNLLYDAMLVPNLSAEIPLGANWSMGLGCWYTWLNNNPRHRYWRSYGGEIYARRYLGHQASLHPLMGHHVGITGQVGMYDVEFGHRGYMSDFSYAAGIEYGYAFPMGRRLSLDLSLGMGYIGGKYKVYDPIDTHYVWQETKRKKWLGPVKAEISLAYHLGKSSKKEKGAWQ